MTDILSQLGYLAIATRFRRISEKLYTDGDRVYQEAGVPFKASWFSVYYVLAKASVPLTVTQIADRIDFSHITVKNIVRELARSSLVQVVTNPQDKRAKHITLTPAGEELLDRIKPLWLSFSQALEQIFTVGHPDFISILNRIDQEIERLPVHRRIQQSTPGEVVILDYAPYLKDHFYNLTGYWLLGILKGTLEEEDEFTLRHPDQAYLERGGFVFFAQYHEQIVGCVALKRLTPRTFEFAKLFIDPSHRGLGIATKLIERCMSRCRENQATELWLQTNMSMPEAHRLYEKLGFTDQMAPEAMDVLARTERIMVKEL